MKSKIPTIDVKKYGGKQIAIVDGSIIASGETTKETLERAKKIRLVLNGGEFSS